MRFPVARAKAGGRFPHRSAWNVFRMPLLIGCVTAAGLTFALLGDGVWDGLSWLALSLPIAVAAACWFRAARQADPRHGAVEEGTSTGA